MIYLPRQEWATSVIGSLVGASLPLCTSGYEWCLLKHKLCMRKRKSASIRLCHRGQRGRYPLSLGLERVWASSTRDSRRPALCGCKRQQGFKKVDGVPRQSLYIWGPLNEGYDLVRSGLLLTPYHVLTSALATRAINWVGLDTRGC